MPGYHCFPYLYNLFPKFCHWLPLFCNWFPYLYNLFPKICRWLPLFCNCFPLCYNWFQLFFGWFQLFCHTHLSIHRHNFFRMTPHSTPGATSPLSAREESAARGFQPYRSTDDLRAPIPSSLALDQAAAAAAAAYSYPAFLPPHAFPHPAFRYST